eukprot:comp18655_c0_seq1/m.33768 comp18655_c0_seq1/g.33768  ORF comp18655_c0_seq1/g.33768 comp18655_c0_seq1/m.33768 type:complete len:290 (+) comp18655_c0_seq1:3-872(+)
MAGTWNSDRYKTQVHGGNPTFLIEKITREKILIHPYWREHCFGLNAATLLEKAARLEYIGGTYGGTRKPTPFICLVLKLLEICPPIDFIHEYMDQSEYKYVRALGCFYFRLVAASKDIYPVLETFYVDYRKLRYRNTDGSFKLVHMDEMIHSLLHEKSFCDTVLPHILARNVLENTNQLPKRISSLKYELDELQAKLEMQTDDAMDDDEQQHNNHEEMHAEDEPPKPKRPREEGAPIGKLVVKGLKKPKKDGVASQPQHQPSSSEKNEEMSIEETNKLRAKLGLKPLKP